MTFFRGFVRKPRKNNFFCNQYNETYTPFYTAIIFTTMEF